LREGATPPRTRPQHGLWSCATDRPGHERSGLEDKCERLSKIIAYLRSYNGFSASLLTQTRYTSNRCMPIDATVASICISGIYRLNDLSRGVFILHIDAISPTASASHCLLYMSWFNVTVIHRQLVCALMSHVSEVCRWLIASVDVITIHMYAKLFIL